MEQGFLAQFDTLPKMPYNIHMFELRGGGRGGWAPFLDNLVDTMVIMLLAFGFEKENSDRRGIWAGAPALYLPFPLSISSR